MEDVYFVYKTMKDEDDVYYVEITAIKHGAVIAEHTSFPMNKDASLGDMRKLEDEGTESLKKFILKHNLV